MRQITPSLKTTQHSPDLREWIPSTFDNFRREIQHLSHHCEGDDPIVLFRGHTNADWYLDCSLVRTLLTQRSFGSTAYPRPMSFHTCVVDVLLTKFGQFLRPSDESIAKQQTHGIDPWYELMKRFQQYAEKDSQPKGTFLIDWTTDPDVALYFATYEGRGDSRHSRQTEGVVWVCDPVPTGKILQTLRLGELLDLMRQDDFRLKAERTLPLILHPTKQTKMLRASNQSPVYFSQMDFRFDLADVWSPVETQAKTAIFRKIILTQSLVQDSIAYLENHGITEKYIYPE